MVICTPLTRAHTHSTIDKVAHVIQKSTNVQYGSMCIYGLPDSVASPLITSVLQERIMSESSLSEVAKTFMFLLDLDFVTFTTSLYGRLWYCIQLHFIICFEGCLTSLNTSMGVTILEYSQLQYFDVNFSQKSFFTYSQEAGLCFPNSIDKLILRTKQASYLLTSLGF